MRNKIVTFKGDHLCHKNDLPFYKELLIKERFVSFEILDVCFREIFFRWQFQ